MSRLSDFPQRLRASTERPDVVYTRADDYYAVHGAPRGRAAKDAVLTLSDDEGPIAVFEGEPKRDNQKISAVYKSGSGSLAVPTGQVFIRFAEGVQVQSQEADLRRLGYVVAQSLSYAPNAAWLRHEKNDVAAALCNIDTLEGLSRVENVEPQLLSPRSFRQP